MRALSASRSDKPPGTSAYSIAGEATVHRQAAERSGSAAAEGRRLHAVVRRAGVQRSSAGVSESASCCQKESLIRNTTSAGQPACRIEVSHSLLGGDASYTANRL